VTVPSAKIVADSISPEGVRLTTGEVRIQRFMLPEWNTHRTLSRNSGSNRAIPVNKTIQRILDDLAMPVSWPAEQKGMQGGEELDEQTVTQAKANWALAAERAIEAARAMQELGLHKSVINRLLEPFQWHTIVATATAWQNFFDLRLDTDAQADIRWAAKALKAAMDESTPKLLDEGLWHLPYWDREIDGDAFALWARANWPSESAPLGWRHDQMRAAGYPSIFTILVRVSAARCARVSYLTHDGKRDIGEDLRLYDQLVTNRVGTGKGVHWSPLEHVATPWAANRQVVPQLFRSIGGESVQVDTSHLPRIGNLLGWRSLRTEVEAIHNAKTFS
jgi:thymidylate synthase ThyX